MKNSIYGVLLISSFALSFGNQLFADDAQPKNVDHGFNGSSSSETFRIQKTDNPEQTSFTLIKDFVFEDTANLVTANKSVFTHSSGNWVFDCANHDFRISRLNSTAEGVCIHSAVDGKSITISKVDDLIIRSSPANYSGKGAIVSNSSLLFTDVSVAIFEENTSLEDGGVISCVKSTKAGASTPRVSFNQIEFLIVAKNGSKKNGGAFCADNLLLTANNSAEFRENSALGSGGAIYGNSVVLTTNHGMTFRGNRAQSKGGAICIAPSGSLSLTANTGDMVFVGNHTVTNGDIVQNSIHLSNNAKCLFLNARAGSSIIFNDPITSEGSVNTPLKINAPNGGTTFHGAIQFLPLDNTSEISRTSRFPQPVSLESGSLRLHPGAIVQARSLEQKPRSLLFLDRGSALTVESGADICNLHMSMENMKIPPVKISGTNPTATVHIGGPIVVHLDDEMFYNQQILAQETEFDLAHITVPSLENIMVSEVPTSPHMTMISHRGYQGNWEISWDQQPQDANHNAMKKMQLLWRPSGYVPFQGGTEEFMTSLVPNSLWSLYLDTRTSQRAIDLEALPLSESGLWASAITGLQEQAGNDRAKGFLHKSLGYFIGGQLQTLDDDIFRVGISQLFGSTEDHAHGKVNNKFFSGSLYFQHTRPLLPIVRFLSGTSTYRPRVLCLIPRSFPITFHALATYSHNRNRMHVSYMDTTTTTSSWNTYGYSAEIGTSLTFSLDNTHTFFHYASPFIKLHWISAYQVQFQEEGIKRRSFSGSRLRSLALPIGLKIHGSAMQSLSYELSAMYSGDIFRDNPNNVTHLLSGGILPWTTIATNLHKHAAIFRGFGNLALTQFADIFSTATIELRRSFYNYNVDLGTKINF
ncbi:autotransporter beta-domain protein [Chlamydia ibidis]|uniref:Autotransporter beta-domain protein n=2 Tax=Chlamydia ibidis TaxID=1405396 RepID=S7J573_9CHLA|nr:autotransporter domain-containing protein [Chlamydia ibidis]EPP35363.1 autotransporter beta-domain protein [Chlamydia ibidis]EQM63011.1 autotransporter beta-domain protein [Chlamydia ibidis 10-1398/6]